MHCVVKSLKVVTATRTLTLTQTFLVSAHVAFKKQN